MDWTQMFGIQRLIRFLYQNITKSIPAEKGKEQTGNAQPPRFGI